MSTAKPSGQGSESEEEMSNADLANGEGSPNEDRDEVQAPANTAEAKYGTDESPA